MTEQATKEQSKPESLSTEEQALLDQISQDLGETQVIPLRLIEEIIRVCGVEFAKSVLDETFRLEANGGLMTHNNKRRRTTGGVFFYVARGRMTKEQDAAVYSVQTRMRNPGSHKPPFHFDKRSPVIGSQAQDKGESEEVRVTIIGRPGKANHFRDLVVMTMFHDTNDASIPAGVPNPPSQRIIYTVYIGYSQWHKIQDELKDKTMALVVEGIVAYDEETESMAVYATKLSTRRHRPRDDNDVVVTKQNVKPPEKVNPGKSSTARASKSNGKATAKARPRPAVPQVEESDMPEPDIPESAPNEVATKLRTLHIAAHQYRKKIASLEEKPENQRFGLDMTRKLLDQTERQISTLEAKYK